MGLAQRLCDFQVRGVNAGSEFQDEEQHIAIGDRLLPLPTNRSIEGIGRPRYQTAGVHEPEPASVPLRRRKVSVARDPGLRIHDRLAPADDPVEQRRLPDVGPADDGYGGNGHTVISWLTSASAKSYDSLTGIGSCAARSCASTSSINNKSSLTASAGSSARSRSSRSRNADSTAAAGSKPAVVTDDPNSVFSSARISNGAPVAADNSTVTCA